MQGADTQSYSAAMGTTRKEKMAKADIEGEDKWGRRGKEAIEET